MPALTIPEERLSRERGEVGPGQQRPSLRFTGNADFNGQAPHWHDGVGDWWVHGAANRKPAEVLLLEQPHLGHLPD